MGRTRGLAIALVASWLGCVRDSREERPAPDSPDVAPASSEQGGLESLGDAASPTRADPGGAEVACVNPEEEPEGKVEDLGVAAGAAAPFEADLPFDAGRDDAAPPGQGTLWPTGSSRVTIDAIAPRTPGLGKVAPTLDALVPSLRTCVELSRHPDRAGSAILLLTFEGGRVSARAKPASHGGNTSDVLDCFEHVLRRTPFAIPKGAKCTVRVSWTAQSSSVEP